MATPSRGIREEVESSAKLDRWMAFWHAQQESNARIQAIIDSQAGPCRCRCGCTKGRALYNSARLGRVCGDCLDQCQRTLRHYRSGPRIQPSVSMDGVESGNV